MGIRSESKEEIVKQWAARWDLQWSLTDLEACFDDAASMAGAYYNAERSDEEKDNTELKMNYVKDDWK